LILVFTTLAFFQCSNKPATVLEQISEDILLKENPDKGVFSLRMQAPGYTADPNAKCNPSNNEYIQVICDAEKSCAKQAGTDKLACIYDAMKTPIHNYEKSLKSDHNGKDSDTNPQNSTNLAIWRDVKKVFNEIKELVNELRESSTEHAESGSDENLNPNYVANKINEIYTMIQSLKEKYGPQNQIKINVNIASVEAFNEQSGWVKVATNAVTEEESDIKGNVKVNFAVPDLNRVVAMDSLPPGKYTAFRVNFADGNEIYKNEPSGSPTNSTTSSIEDRKDREDRNKEDDVEAGLTWNVYPLVFEANDTKQRTVFQDVQITSLKRSSLALSLAANSYSLTWDGQYVFNPVFSIESVTGDEYLNPADPVSLAFDNGNLILNADANTFDKPVRFDAKPIAAADLPVPIILEANIVSLGAYDMQPSMVFNKAVKLIFKYDPAIMAAHNFKVENIQARYFHKDRQTWINIPTLKVDEYSHTVTVSTNHFTIISIIGSSKFKQIYPGGITERIQFSALNYFFSKYVILNPSLKKGELKDYSKEAAKIYIATADIESKDFRIVVSKSPNPNQIKISIQVSNTPLATIYGKLLGLFDFRQEYFIETMDISFNYDVNLDSNGRLSILNPVMNSAYLTYKKNPMQSDFLGEILTWLFSNGQNIDAVIAAKMDQYKGTVIDALAKDFPGQIGKTVNDALADSKIDSPNYVIDDMGLQFQKNINATISGFPDLSTAGSSLPGFAIGQCSPPVNFIINDYVPPSVLNLPPTTDIGIGFSIKAMNQIFNEIANRGYFCYHYIDTPSGALVSIQPNSAPTYKYVGNYISRLRVPVTVIATTVLGATTETGNIDYYFRMNINIGGNSISFGAVKVKAGFSNPATAGQINPFINILNANLAFIPDFGFSLANSLNSNSFQPSTFKMNMVEEINGTLTYGIDMRGLEIFTTPQNPNVEWTWSKGWGKDTSVMTEACSPFSIGTVEYAPAGSVTPYIFRLKNNQTVFLNNDKIFPLLFDSIIHKEVTLEGTCRYIPTFQKAVINNKSTNTVVKYHQVYYARNIVTDHFFMQKDGDLLPKSNLVAQVMDNFSTTLAAYEVNITGNAVPEILQVRYGNFIPLPPGVTLQDGVFPPREFFLDWYLSNTCCNYSPNDVNKYTMPLPAEFTSEGLYRVSVIKRSAGFDQVLLNCKVYDVSVVNNSTVHLVETQNICREELAGVVVDDQNSLMWTKCSLGQNMYDPNCTGTATDMSPVGNAESACTNVEVAGFKDWRLPTAAEYQTLPPQNPANLAFPDPFGLYWMKQNSVTTYKVLASYGPWSYDMCPFYHHVACTLIFNHGAIDSGFYAKFSSTAADGLIRYSTYSGYTDYRTLIVPQYFTAVSTNFNIQYVAPSDALLFSMPALSGPPYHSHQIRPIMSNLVDQVVTKTRCVRNMN